MTLTLTVIVTIGIAVTIGTYLFSRHHLAVLSDRVEEAVRLDVERVRQKAQESEDRLIQAFVSSADETEAVKGYQREQAQLLTGDNVNEPWNWQELELHRWAEQARRDRCATARRSTCFVASGTVLSVWTIIAVVTLVGLRNRETMAMTVADPSAGADVVSEVPDLWQDIPLAPAQMPALPLDLPADRVTAPTHVGIPGSDGAVEPAQADQELTTDSERVPADEPSMGTEGAGPIPQENQR